MADIVTDEGARQTPTGLIGSQFNWVFDNMGLILLGIGIIITAVVIWFLIAKIKSEQREKRNMQVEHYNNVIRDCKAMAHKWRIKKRRKVVGFPFRVDEQSTQVVDMNMNLIGYYRGHCYSMDGALHFLLYKETFFGLMEQQFVLRVPTEYRYEVYLKDSGGNVMFNKDKTYATETKSVPLMGFVQNLDSYRDRSTPVIIDCISIERLGWFKYPIFLSKNHKTVDLREQENDKLIETGYAMQLNKHMRESARMVDIAMDHNPSLKYTQKEPVKTHEEEQRDHGTE